MNILNNELGIGHILLGLALVVSIIWNIVNHQKIDKVVKQHELLMRGMTEANIEEVVIKYIKEVDAYRDRIDKIEAKILAQDKKLAKQAANQEIVRYNAYEDQGNDLSFSLAILNDDHDGFVLTSLYNRNDQRVYAKPVKAGVSSYQLTEEEIEVIKKAGKLAK